MTKLSVAIITKNEEHLIGRCIRSVSWADEVVVLDSGSDDRTVEIAKSLGAKLFFQPFLGFPQQKNRAVSLCTNDWILFLEADEIVTPELRASVEKVLAANPNPLDGYYPDRRPDCLGVLMDNDMRSSKRPTLIRLFNRTEHLFPEDAAVHEEFHVRGRALPLSGLLLHWRGMTVDESILSCNKYASIEAKMLRGRGASVSLTKMALRPLARFFWFYFFQGCWKKGVNGYLFCMFKFVNEFVRYAKLWEMEHVVNAADPPPSVYPASESSSHSTVRVPL